MASKFMAFEGVAGTSTASMSDNGDDENERIEMNSSQYPNYQSNQNYGQTTIETGPYGVVDEENDLNDENLEEKCDKSVGYRKFIHRNSEQLKSICGGLLLLVGCGIHIVWGIFRVFNCYQCNQEKGFYLRFVIWSWYIGAIAGNITAAYIATKLQKRHIYVIGAALLMISGMFIALSDADTNIYLLISRFLGGFTQGLIYVTVIVHASENATKEFREFLMLIVGAVMNYSILISVLAFFHTERLIRLSIMNGISLFAFGIFSMIFTSKHATETIPFILQTNGSEMDALQTMGKLKKKSIAAQSVHHDFLILKNLVQDEMDHYGLPTFSKVFLPENRKSFIFCCYGRLCSVLSFNLPLIVMIMLFLRGWMDESAKEHGAVVENYCKDLLYDQPFTHKIEYGKIEIEKPNGDAFEHNKEDKHDRNTRDVDHEGESADERKKVSDAKARNDFSSKTQPTSKGEAESIQNSNQSNTKASESEKKINENSTKKTDEKKPDKNDHEHSTVESENNKKENEKSPEVGGIPFIGHLLTFLHGRELTIIVLLWFIFGSLTAAILYTLNLRRFIYYAACALSIALTICGMAHSFHSFSSILHFCLIVYFNYVTIPIDLFGHCMLAEAFPITLKAYSIAGVSIVEHTVHIIIIALYMTEWFHDSIILFMCIVAFVSHEIARNLPQQNDLSLGEAREQYQHMDLMLFNELKIANNQQQEFI